MFVSSSRQLKKIKYRGVDKTFSFFIYIHCGDNCMLGILFLMSSVGISLNHLRMVLSPVNLGDFISDKSLI